MSRVLGVLCENIGVTKIPCPQTIINWVTRLSIVRINAANQLVGANIPGDPFSNGFIWTIDISIGLGVGKILTVLALNANHHQLNPAAPTLQNTHCIAVSVAASWTGEMIAEFLRKIISVLGRPAALLKDGGSDLGKAARLLMEQGFPCLTIDDISHKIANILKHEYETHPLFKIFMAACGKASTKLKQTLLACLAPPKVSVKARFMNLHRLVMWAGNVLKHSPKGRAAKNSMLAKLRASLDRIPECKKFISSFISDATPLLECQKIMKNKGLSNETYEECQNLIENIPSASVRVEFNNWVTKQLEIKEQLGLNGGLSISSDSIESLFGVGKKHGTGTTKDAYRIATRLPAMCGKLTKDEAQQVLEVSVKEEQEVIGSLPSLIGQRRNILPKPGTIEKLKDSKTSCRFELIPRSKKWSKNLVKPDALGDYKKTVGTSDGLKNIDMHPPDVLAVGGISPEQ